MMRKKILSVFLTSLMLIGAPSCKTNDDTTNNQEQTTERKWFVTINAAEATLKRVGDSALWQLTFKTPSSPTAFTERPFRDAFEMPDGLNFIESLWPWAFNDAPTPNAAIFGAYANKGIQSVFVEVLDTPDYKSATAELSVNVKVLTTTSEIDQSINEIKLENVGVVVDAWNDCVGMLFICPATAAVKLSVVAGQLYRLYAVAQKGGLSGLEDVALSALTSLAGRAGASLSKSCAVSAGKCFSGQADFEEADLTGISSKQEAKLKEQGCLLFPCASDNSASGACQGDFAGYSDICSGSGAACDKFPCQTGCPDKTYHYATTNSLGAATVVGSLAVFNTTENCQAFKPSTYSLPIKSN